MLRPTYPYQRIHSKRYTFLSDGPKGTIKKVVEFAQTLQKNTFNISFGDVLPDGIVNDTANTNNNDIIKVLSTVIEIINDFTKRRPHAKIIFMGSTEVRTLLYLRVLRTYYPEFASIFNITIIEKNDNQVIENAFDPSSFEKPLAFFVKRK